MLTIIIVILIKLIYVINLQELRYNNNNNSIINNKTLF